MPGGKDVSKNIEELYRANKSRPKPRPRRQIVAIAESQARAAKKGKRAQ